MSRSLLVILGVLLLPGLVEGAGPVFWDWPADRPFSELELAGAAVDADGHLIAGLSAHVLGTDGVGGPEGPEVFWRAVPDGKGGAYVGTGHGGQLIHTTGAGESRLLASLGSAEIFSLLRLSNGDLLAGGGPDGQLHRIEADGNSRVVGTVPGGYIWALAQATPQGPVWVATGSPAGLYRYEPSSGRFAEELVLPALNTLDVLPLADDVVLVATQGPGLVYRCEAGGSPRLLVETPQDEARQFVRGPEGQVFLLALHATGEENSGMALGSENAPTATPPSLLPMLGRQAEPDVPAAALFRINPDGKVEPWWSGAEALTTAAWSPRWGWLAGGPLGEKSGQAELRSLTPPWGSHVVARWTGGDVLDIMMPAGASGELIICQAQPGALVGLGDQGQNPPLALSAPLDGGAPVSWGRLTWRGEGPQGRLRWSVRGGNRSLPDETWTPWSKSWTEADHALDLAPCRFLQWRVEFPAGLAPENGWRVTEVAVSAWQDNLPPVVTAFQLEHLADMSFGGMMNGSDNVTQRFRSGLMAEYSRNVTPDNWVGPTRSAFVRSLRVFTWQATDPNGDRISYRLEYRQVGTTSWRPISIQRPGEHETSETLATWDTAEVPDGEYELRLTASDRRDNPAHLARETERHFGPLAVDNTAPTISDFKVRATASGFAVRCRAEDKSSALAGAQLVLPDGSLERLDPVDRICDSRSEEFAVEFAWPRPGTLAGPRPWLVRVEVQDLGGNLGGQAGEVP